MRFTITLERFDLVRGGAEVATLRLVRELAARGHEVHIITTGVAVELPAGATVELIRLPPCWVPWQQISFARQVRRRLARADCDLSVAACGRGFSEDVLWAQNGAFRGALEGQARSYYFNPVLRWLRRHQHWFSLRSRVYLELERRHFTRRPPPFVLAPSQMIAAQFMRTYRLPEERIRVANYRVDGHRFSPARLRPLRAEARRRFDLAPTELAIICVAQNFRRKGVRPLIEAAARLRRRREDFRVLIAGLDLRAAQPYLRLAQQLGCAGQVRFLGQQKRIEELYAAADVFCLPTFADPCAIASVEAMVCGLPSVTSRFNGAAELMQHGRDGFIVEDPANADELAAVLAPLFDPGRREAVGRAAAAAAARFAATEGEDPVVTAVEEMARICRRERGMAEPRPRAGGQSQQVRI